MTGKLLSFIDEKIVHVSTNEFAVDAVGMYTVAKERLGKLCDLEKKVLEKTSLSDKELLRVKEEQIEAQKQLALLELYKSRLKTRQKRGRTLVRVTGKMKDVMDYAEITERKYSKYIGATPNYFPTNTK